MDVIAAIAGAVLSLVFSYVPGAKGWYEGLDGTYKRLVMLGLLALAVLVELGLACSGLGADFGLQVSCDRAGFVALARAFFAALMANQATYLISPALKQVSTEPVYEDVK